MDLGIKLGPTRDIERAIVEAINQLVVLAIAKSLDNIKDRIQRVIIDRINGSSEFQSLLDGQLRAELGVPSRSDILGIVDAVANDIELTALPPSSSPAGKRGGIRVGILESSYKSLFSLPGSSFTSNGKEIPWLEWLLLAGDAILVRDYNVEFNLSPEQLVYSRTGEALMIVNPGETWRVPPEFSGVKEDNFITRALEGIQDDIAKIIEVELVKELK